MSALGPAWLQRLAAVASLHDAHRRALFTYVRGADDAVGRDEAALALCMPRSTASFHLDRLARDGLLQVEFRKSTKKAAGPGSGRPAKLYKPALDEVGVSVPARHYDLAGDLMATAILRSSAGGVPVVEALLQVAESKGRDAGRPGDLMGALADLGYEPLPDSAGGYRLINCPFRRLSRDHAEVVCSMNGAFLRGAAEASGLDPSVVVPHASTGHCCARIAAVGDGPQSWASASVE
ncbi:helix-turn-helix transcriptional regulator [Paenarthrobacter sp. FR1]|uniref:helix-turn-helix transcriptional regulator n=1 Tax=Paenarthrobacter sp. FR1 TaxID=3439548 RepID=UPI003DA32C82